MFRKVGRNQPCPCGSEKKYKHCCWGKDVQFGAKKRNMLLLGGALVVVLVTVLIIRSNNSSNPTFQSGAPSPAPLGKVWSPEHGHWHDAFGTAPAIPPANLQTLGDAPGVGLDSRLNLQAAPGISTQLASQPLGPAPPGKVWSPEHGHWHDAPNSDSL